MKPFFGYFSDIWAFIPRDSYPFIHCQAVPLIAQLSARCQRFHAGNDLTIQRATGSLLCCYDMGVETCRILRFSNSVWVWKALKHIEKHHRQRDRRDRQFQTCWPWECWACVLNKTSALAPVNQVERVERVESTAFHGSHGFHSHSLCMPLCICQARFILSCWMCRICKMCWMKRHHPARCNRTSHPVANSRWPGFAFTDCFDCLACHVDNKTFVLHFSMLFVMSMIRVSHSIAGNNQASWDSCNPAMQKAGCDKWLQLLQPLQPVRLALRCWAGDTKFPYRSAL